jgi:hypothetical protein
MKLTLIPNGMADLNSPTIRSGTEFWPLIWPQHKSLPVLKSWASLEFGMVFIVSFPSHSSVPKTLSAEHRPRLCSPSWAVMSPYKWKTIEREVNQKINKQNASDSKILCYWIRNYLFLFNTQSTTSQTVYIKIVWLSLQK